MAEQKKIQLYTDRACTVEASPETSAKCVILSDGNDLQKVLDNDLTNPTVVHEETSFKVGVGDINVSSSVVDGEVGRMVIKGKTYQNILPEPSTHVLTNNKEMFKVNEGLDSNVEIVDAVSKSAILKGQTLVNIFKSNELPYSHWGTNKDFSCNCQQGKTYTLIFNIFLPSFVEGKSSIRIECGFLNSWTTRYSELITNANTNLSIKTKATFNNTEDQTIRFISQHSTLIDDVLIKEIMVLEGDYTNVDIPYFEGMQSVRMPVLTTTGKNLFDGFSNVIEENGEYSLDAVNRINLFTTKLILKANKTVTISYEIKKHSDFGQKPCLIYGNNEILMSQIIGLDWVKQNIAITPETDCVLNFGIGTSSNSFGYSLRNIQIEEGSVATSYEPFKSNILTTSEDVVLRGIGDVKDTLDCLTGELTNRLGYTEHLLQDLFNFSTVFGRGISYQEASDRWVGLHNGINHAYFNTMLPLNFSTTNDVNSNVSIYKVNSDWFGIAIKSSELVSKGYEATADGLLDYAKNEKMICTYKLPNKVIKTVDLSTSGNWEKVVLDGSENWESRNGGTKYSYTITNIFDSEGADGFCDTFKFIARGSSNNQQEECVTSANTNNSLSLFTNNESLSSVGKLKTYLQSNPITVWYQTATHQDSTQVKQPIFFKDGHIQLSSGADNSLIPTLDYQAKTSNSYVMDLMKANTRYTMKAKSASGTFTIDGTSYGAGTNGTFTTPSSMTNKFLVMSNNANEEVMILEGDVVSKSIPYFKGIKSAFEDESKIEVLSTGKNLTHHILGGNLESKEYNFMNIIETHKNTSGALNRAKVIKWVEKDKFFIKGYGIDQYDNQYNIDLTPTVLKPNTTYFISFESIEGSHEQQEDMKLTLGTFDVWLNNTRVIRAYEGGTYTFTTPSQVDSFNLNFWLDGTKNKNATIYAIFNKFMITEGKNIDEGYEPHKSNSTKIPLLSPLRSLPNGVCDGLIIDRMKKKATLIQRVGVGVLDGTQNIIMAGSSVDTSLYQPFFCGDVFGNMAVVPRDVVVVRCDKLLANSQSPEYRGLTINAIYQYTDSSARLAGQITRKDLGVKGVKDWFRANPTTVYYQLATPVVTEIDLENFPLVYKDGHIFLNSEIAPVVEINYNVNQAQQIQSNNETLQRHELDILDLDNLIVSFVNAEYNLRLLKFNMELSMMALAE